LTTKKIAVFAPMPSASVRKRDGGKAGSLGELPEGEFEIGDHWENRSVI
jgi:hypothetical protein